jgi:hypothetical protein
VLDRQDPEPKPPPVTTLAWRIVHVGTAMSTRTSTFFGDGPAPADADMFHPGHWPAELPGTATDGIRFLEDCYAGWHRAISTAPGRLSEPTDDLVDLGIVARARVRGPLADLQHRLLLGADVLGLPAAGAKAASGRRVRR